ncbi:MAG: leucine--tRNA ligase [Myxococcales bacterium]|nr:MAG: leucine--tRNA ligase [Myxococcales bacterium]
MQERYEAEKIENKWQKTWAEQKLFAANASEGPHAYILEMLPYPSGKIHMGHVRNYAIGDAVARHLHMQGKNVLHPMGWDAFGMPAENAAIAHGRHPNEWTRQNIDQMRVQLKRLGLSYDWSREFATCEPTYYKHEQAMFLRMLEKGLAYRDTALANWCESCQTVLANEQVEEGRCWRCSNEVVQKELAQWFIRTTAYAQELLDDLDGLEGRWPDKVLNAQRNWIGRSVGAEVQFPLETPSGDTKAISVFTTRPDTLYGVTFLSIAAEHPLATAFAQRSKDKANIEAFIQRLRQDHKSERSVDDTKKEGMFTGEYCLHPLTGEKIPIWIANFVLMDYGTGAVMAVPAHDERDFEFARVYDLAIKVVIAERADQNIDPNSMKVAFTESGVLINSAELCGVDNESAKEKIIAQLQSKKLGKKTVNFRLRDWLVSRQRYWGTPIPVVHCAKDGIVPVDINSLPVELPLDVTISGDGGSPLAKHEGFLHTNCPRCGGPAKRETDTFDTFVESSWYFYRYMSPQYEKGPVDLEQAKHWLPVDLYIGGDEHAVMHLMYARFWHKMMIDLGYLSKECPREPTHRLLTQGMVCHEVYFRQNEANPTQKTYFYPKDTEIRDGARVLKSDGQAVQVGPVIKMSKSKNNLVDPDELIQSYGADTARLFVLFAAPPEGQVDWNEAGVEGMHRFLQRLWRLVRTHRDRLSPSFTPAKQASSDKAKELRRNIHQCIEKVSRDLGEKLRLNTAIAAQMELLNALSAFEAAHDDDYAVLNEGIHTLLRLLAPFAPHMCEELHALLGGEGLISSQAWPSLDSTALEQASFEIPVQINGKVRGRISIAPGTKKDEVVAAAKRDAKISAQLQGKDLIKTVYVPDRILTFVVKN